MAAIQTSQTAFSANEQITSAKLNNILLNSSFAAGALTGDNTLTLVSNQMQVGVLKTANFPAGVIDQTMIGTNVVGKGPAFRAKATIDTSIGVQTHTPVNLAVVFGNFANNKFTATVAGYYLMSGQIFSNIGPGGLLASIAKNNIQNSFGSQTNGASFRSVVSDVIYLDVGDEVALHAYAGAATTIQTSAADTYFSGCLIRSA